MRFTKVRTSLTLTAFMAAFQTAPALAVSCIVAPQSVNFGQYDSLTRAEVDGVGRVSLTCDGAAHFEISLGQGSGSDYLQRSMFSAQAKMGYNLYTSSSRTTIWGDGSAGSSTVAGSGTGGEFTVYGRIAAGQNLPAGAYVDTVVITVTY